MDRKKTYKSRVSEAVHEMKSDAYSVGAIDKTTMREFDAMCLTKIEMLSPKDIQGIRKREGMSQAVFAHYLNVTPNLVSRWERGDKRPRGTSLKLLAIVKAKGLDAIA
jgi:putative transcriptional regulator